jgi:DNA invertase Pin-like site-specific DNA recombinase
MLMVATPSRLGRRVSFVSGLMDKGTPFACADAPDDDSFILHLKTWFVEEKARKISYRTKAALAMAKANGKRFGNPTHLTDEARRRGAVVLQARSAAQHTAIRPQIANYAKQAHRYDPLRIKLECPQ